MPNFVTKKDGTRVPFNGKKIMTVVTLAAHEAGVSDSEANHLALRVVEAIETAFKDEEEISSAKIRDVIFSELEVMAPAVLESWKYYEEGKGL